MSIELTKVPVMTRTQQPDGEWSKEHFHEGPVGGFTFDDGRKSMIYQCGDCGQLCEFSDTYNNHKRTHDPKWVNTGFGWADGEPEWKEVDCDPLEILQRPCSECGGEKYIDVVFNGDDSRKEACEKCNLGGDEPDEDRAYDEMKDAEAEHEAQKEEARD